MARKAAQWADVGGGGKAITTVLDGRLDAETDITHDMGCWVTEELDKVTDYMPDCEIAVTVSLVLTAK